MLDGRFAISIHILSLLSMEDGLSSEYIAASININPVLVRKELIRLKNANLIETKIGKNGGSYLLKPANKISLAEVFDATYDQELFSHSKNKPNPKCPVGRNISAAMAEINKESYEALNKKLSKISIARLVEQM